MTGRHRAPQKVWPLAVCCAALGVASLGAAVAPREAHTRHAVAEPAPVLTIRAPRTAFTITAATTVSTTEMATTPVRACRCLPRAPIATEPTPLAQNTSVIATSALVPPATTTQGLPTTPERETTLPSPTEPGAPVTTTPATTTEAPTTSETTEPSATPTALPTSAVETTEVTEEEP